MAESSIFPRGFRFFLVVLLFLIQGVSCFAFNVNEGSKLDVDSTLLMGMDYRYEADNFPGRSGFRLTDARFYAEAEYLEILEFNLKLDFADISEDEADILKTATAQYHFADPFRLKAGYGKIPYGEEYSKGICSRNAVYHSEASELMVPGRSVGLTLSGKEILGRFGYKTGFYNGTTGSWDKNHSGLHIAAANVFFENSSIKSGYNIMYSLDESFGQGLYVDINHDLKENICLLFFSEYMEQRYYNYHWNHSLYTLLGLRVNNVEPLLYFDYYNDNVGYDGPEDKWIPGLGFNAYFHKDKVQLKTDIRTEYLFSYPSSYELKFLHSEIEKNKFYNTKLTVKLVVEL